MVAPDSVDKAKQILDNAGIEYHVSTLDMQRYVNLWYKWIWTRKAVLQIPTDSTQ